MQRERVLVLNHATPRAGADWVLYWAQANRRADANHALEFAAEMANERGLPLLVYEGLAPDSPHPGFVLDGIAEQERRLAARGIGYLFHAGGGALAALAARAALVVTDDHPLCAPGPAHYAVDSSCIVPMSMMPKREWAAYSIRPKIRRLLPRFLRPVEAVPLRRPYRGGAEEFRAPAPAAAAAPLPGGRLAAERTLADFCRRRLRRYAREKNEPSAQATSGLSPYLHFGQISPLEVALAVKKYAERHKLIAEEFLEELIVRRELAFNFARFTPQPHTLAALPDWAQRTLRKHARDRRPFVYSREQFENAATHDPLWNATQRELLTCGRIHGYYRMYWGKKIIEWSRTCEDALVTMIYLNDRYALDGRDPNGYANILWCFGLHDRPWPERPVLGSVRYMSYEGMRRKTGVDAYIAAHSA
ncbi:MAG: deoxyribodipyrimidine photolyase [Bryobacteraceae bacterium]